MPKSRREMADKYQIIACLRVCYMYVHVYDKNRAATDSPVYVIY